MNRGLLLLITAAGCGEPLVGPEFLGTPVLEIGGAVILSSPRVPADHGPVRLSLFWIGLEALNPAASVEQGAELDSGFGSFSMTLFDPPPAGATAFDDLMLDRGRLGFALIALYADRDGDQELDLAADLLLGASDRHLVIWSEAPVPETSPAFELLGPINSGYHVFHSDQASDCRFVEAAECESAGGLIRVPLEARIPLTLWAAPEEVLVPSPRLPVPGSIWSH